MTFNPSEFLRLANELARDNSDEAKLRSAVGRAYYAVFLQARESLGLSGNRRRIHRLVIGRLKGTDRSAGDQLDKLETLRGEADYELVVRDTLHRDWLSNWKSASVYSNNVFRRLRKLQS